MNNFKVSNFSIETDFMKGNSG